VDPAERILITGASGFIGHRLTHLLADSFSVRAVTRQGLAANFFPEGVEVLPLGTLDTTTDWSSALAGVTAVVHLAGRAHQGTSAAEEEQRAADILATTQLAKAAATAGVQRFIYLSSVKAVGEATSAHEPFNDASPCDPTTAYGRAKRATEQALLELSNKDKMRIIILRPPLVYGPGMKANMARLFSEVQRGTPLPLASVNNARSFIFIDNLCSAIKSTLTTSFSTNAAYLLCDGRPVSTPELIKCIGSALNSPVRLFAFPVFLLRFLSACVGQGARVARLTDSLAIDDANFRQTTSWIPPHSLEEGLAITAQAHPS
jgi:nucleoside-diphosphate-sugar epimerase